MYVQSSASFLAQHNKHYVLTVPFMLGWLAILSLCCTAVLIIVSEHIMDLKLLALQIRTLQRRQFEGC